MLCPWQIIDDHICLPNIYNYLAYATILSKMYLTKYHQLAIIIWKRWNIFKQVHSENIISCNVFQMWFKKKNIYIIKNSKTSRQAFRNTTWLDTYLIFVITSHFFFNQNLKISQGTIWLLYIFLHMSPFLQIIENIWLEFFVAKIVE